MTFALLCDQTPFHAWHLTQFFTKHFHSASFVEIQQYVMIYRIAKPTDFLHNLFSD